MDDLTTCKKAAEFFGYQFDSTEEEAGYPKGCYALFDADVYFNQHIDGSKHRDASQICKPIGKGLRSFLTSIYLLS